MNISPLRVSGLASGMDTDAIIQKLMDAHKLPVNKLNQKKQITEWQREAYREMNTKIWSFRNDKLFNFKLEGNLSSRSANLSGYEDALSAKVTGDTQLSTMTINVSQLAAAASNKSATAMTVSSSFDSSKPLGDEDADLVGNFTQTVPPDYDVVSFKINGTAISVDPNVDSLDDVIERINEETNVTAFYDYHAVDGGRISFVSKLTGEINGATGDQADITFEDVTGNFLTDVLRITDPGTSALNSNATVNGLNIERTSNSFTLNGLEITLKKLTGANPDTTVQVTTDADKLVDSIKGFISNYNELLKTVTDKTQESRYRSFTPLSVEQKEAMKEKEIELWESKAKSGLLRSDSILLEAVSKMRLSISAQVDTGNSKYSSLSSIGIETGEYFENGKLYLKDETKLRAAIADDPDAVIAMFTANGSGDSSRFDMGIAERLYEDLDITLDKLTEKAGLDIGLKDGSILGKQVDLLDLEIDKWNSRLVDIEDRYYRQFTAMERAISQYNSQSAYLMNAFGGQS